MKGVIKFISPRGMVAVLTENQYSIFELLSHEEIYIEDVISWQDDTSLGDTDIINHSQNTRFSAYFQNHHVTTQHLSSQL